MNKELRKAFKEAVGVLLDCETNFSPTESPRTCLVWVIGMLKRKPAPKEIKEMEEVLSDILREFGAEIDPNSLFSKEIERRKKEREKKRRRSGGRPDWVTEGMMRGAKAAEHRHPDDAKGL